MNCMSENDFFQKGHSPLKLMDFVLKKSKLRSYATLRGIKARIPTTTSRASWGGCESGATGRVNET